MCTEFRIYYFNYSRFAVSLRVHCLEKVSKACRQTVVHFYCLIFRNLRRRVT